MTEGVVDPYADASTGVLRNLLGITDADVLAVVEARVVRARDAELIRGPEPGSYDLAHLCRMHRRLFGDVYDWAGTPRTVQIARDLPFAHPAFIEDSAAAMFGQLRDEDWLRGLGRDQFVERLAYFLGEVNALHPFREGNGRTQRVFFRQLAAEAGWHLDWTSVTAEQNTAASRASLAGDLEPLRRILDRIAVPLAD